MLARLLLLLVCICGSATNEPEKFSPLVIGSVLAASQNTSEAKDVVHNKNISDHEGSNDEDEASRVLSDSTDLGISIMLLGSVSFMMCVFYLVNHSDDRIQFYTWKVISSTCSIFVAVLVFQACNKNIENFLLEGRSCWVVLSIDMLQLLFWVGTMQLVLYYLSKQSKLLKDAQDEAETTAERSEHLTISFEQNVKSWGILLAHISGFASINAWGTLQQNVVHHVGLREVWHQQAASLCVVIFAGFVMGMTLTATSRARRKVYLSGDGKIDEIEELENDLAKETEDDVVGMTISFSLVQVIRFCFTSDMPDVNGNNENPHGMHPFRRVLSLLASGMFFAFLVMKRPGKVFLGEHHQRIRSCAKIAWSTSFAWCLYFAIFWYVRFVFGNYAEDMHATMTVILALVSTAVAFFFIFGLERLEESGLSNDIHAGIKALILSLAILVGFSWERGFDIALDIVAERFSVVFLDDSFCGTGIVVLLLAASLSAVVLPAWMWFILPLELSLEREYEKHKLAEQAKLDEQANPLSPFAFADGEYARLPGTPPATSEQSFLRRGQSPVRPQPPSSPKMNSPRTLMQIATPNHMMAVSQRVVDLKDKVRQLQEMRCANWPREQAPQVAVRCSEIMANLETEAASLNLQLMESKVAIDRQAAEQSHLAEDVLKVRMELHSAYKEFWGAPAG